MFLGEVRSIMEGSMLRNGVAQNITTTAAFFISPQGRVIRVSDTHISAVIKFLSMQPIDFRTGLMYSIYAVYCEFVQCAHF